ncbi:hypothetical protein AB0M47_01645 [Hamadaea sp. NPDC051192]|uniref:hypothetical protein n=1 Tax=Hamadaea sp. NPDC051192 TaxID=3154940 RepID=UPI00341EC711
MYEQANADVIGRRERVAARVRDELAAAGITVCPQTTNALMQLRQGAEVHVDTGADGGVLIAWQTHPLLRDRAVEAVSTNRLDDAALWHNGAVQEAMLAAITTILTSAGFTIFENPDDMNPLTLKVESAPAWDTPLTWESVAADAGS